MFAQFCGGIPLSTTTTLAYAAGVVGEYSKDALIERSDDVTQRILFASSLVTMALLSVARPRLLCFSAYALLVTSFYAVRVPGTRNLTIKTAFPLSKTLFVPIMHGAWFSAVAQIDSSDATQWRGVQLVMLSQLLASCLFDLKDEEDDRRKGCVTVATLLGARQAARVVAWSSAAVAAGCLVFVRPGDVSAPACITFACVSAAAFAGATGCVIQRAPFLLCVSLSFVLVRLCTDVFT